jgi:hypothetical protein
MEFLTEKKISIKKSLIKLTKNLPVLEKEEIKFIPNFKSKSNKIQNLHPDHNRKSEKGKSKLN